MEEGFNTSLTTTVPQTTTCYRTLQVHSTPFTIYPHWPVYGPVTHYLQNTPKIYRRHIHYKTGTKFNRITHSITKYHAYVDRENKMSYFEIVQNK